MVLMEVRQEQYLHMELLRLHLVKCQEAQDIQELLIPKRTCIQAT